MCPDNGERIEEDDALLEALAVPDQALINEGVEDPAERFQILYLSLLLSMVDEAPFKELSRSRR